MNKLFIVADDLTGALDTGVCFASMGISTCVRLPGYSDHQDKSDDYCVEVAIAESRHMEPQDAYHAVYDVVQKAVDAGYRYIYKKTDSAMRGNIGAELAATLDAVKGKTLHFIPAFPKMNRITKGSVLFIDRDTPVAQSVFAGDPFNPVKHSSILQIIAEQTGINAYTADDESDQYPDGIAVHDAAQDTDILRIGRHLVKEVKASLFAGCAGFANALPQLIEFERNGFQDAAPSGKIVFFCGSVNPISLEQCDQAEQDGYPRFHFQCEGIYQDSNAVKERMISAVCDNDIVMLDTGESILDSSDDEVLEQGAAVAKNSASSSLISC
jgi:uncharacterized protein YgbK (DUF1537 family)